MLSKWRQNKHKAFSIIEAFISLVLVSIGLALASPLITKQLKDSSISDVQYREVLKRIDQLEKTQIPKGTVAFFSNAVTPQSDTNPCPQGWSLVPEDWNGRFFRVADEENPRNYTQEQSVQMFGDDALGFYLAGLKDCGGCSFVKVTKPENTAFWVNKSVSDTQPSLLTSKETRPKNVALLACVKD